MQRYFVFSVFKMDYEPLDGSVVSIDTTLNDGFVADDLNVSSFEETVTLDMKPHSNGVNNDNEPIPTSTPNKPTKTQQQLTCKEAGFSYQTSVSGNLKRHANAQTAMDFQLHETTFNHIQPLLTT